MPDQAKNIMIGIFVAAASVIIVFMLLFLHPSVGDEGQIIRVRFSDIDKVTIGTRVTFGGMPVGEVISIKEVPHAMDTRQGHKGFIYAYELELAINSGIIIYNTDSISLRTSGLLGERNVAITPMPALPNEKLKVVNNEIIFADESSSLTEAIKDLRDLSDKAHELITHINEGLKVLKDEKFWENLGKSVENIQSISKAMNKPEEIENTFKNIEEFTNKVVNSWGTVDEALSHIKDASVNTSRMTHSGMEVVNNIREGNGTIGQFAMKDDFYLRTSSIISKVETLADDVNHYGLLFHLDKGWQRLRARRMNLLAKLCSPQEFRNFFNDEINQINTSLSRVYMLLDENICKYPCKFDLSKDCGFTKVYSELLRRVATLEESLKMYNTQLMHEEVIKTELSCP